MVLVVSALFVPCGHAQNKGDQGKGAEPPVALKVQVVLEDFDGAQKVSSAPYVMHLNVGGDAKVRSGYKISSLYTFNGQTSSEYIDVGTNIDCSAKRVDEERFDVSLSITRDTPLKASGSSDAAGQGNDQVGPKPAPWLHSFGDEFHLLMRDGQTMEGTSAVDPTTGHVIKVEVTLDVVK